MWFVNEKYATDIGEKIQYKNKSLNISVQVENSHGSHRNV